MKRQRTKEELLADARLVAARKIQQILSLTILIDIFDFTEDQCNEFIDCYGALLESYNQGDENIKELNNNIYEYCGVSILEWNR